MKIGLNGGLHAESKQAGTAPRDGTQLHSVEIFEHRPGRAIFWALALGTPRGVGEGEHPPARWVVNQHGPGVIRAMALLFALWVLVMIGALVYRAAARRPIAAARVWTFFCIGGVPLGIVAIMALIRFHPELLVEWRILAILAIPIALRRLTSGVD